MKQSEKKIEKALCNAVKEAGGLALKLISPGWAGIPDRLILLPGGRALFVETKTQKEKPKALQQKRHKVLRSLGFKVLVVDEISKIREVFLS